MYARVCQTSNIDATLLVDNHADNRISNMRCLSVVGIFNGYLGGWPGK